MADLRYSLGVQTLTEMLHTIADLLCKETGAEWEVDHEDGRSWGLLRRIDPDPSKAGLRLGLELQLAVDSFTKPKNLWVYTVWRNAGRDAFNNCIFAARLVPGGTDPSATLALRWAPARLAKDIAARVVDPALALAPMVEVALDAIEERRARHDALLEGVADQLHQAHIKPVADGDVSFVGTTEFGGLWKLSVRPDGQAELRASMPSSDWIQLIPALGAMTRREKPAAVPTEPANDTAAPVAMAAE